MKLHQVVILFVSPSIVFGQATPTVKQAPPPGIKVSEVDAAEIRHGLENLGTEIQGLRATLKSNTNLFGLIPDVEVFHKAVRYALSYDEFFKPTEIAAAKAQLSLGLERARELKDRKPVWVAATGPLIRGYRSKIDRSVQPYGLIVPDDWNFQNNKPRPLYLWFHGRGDTLSEVAFIAGRMHGKREFAPSDAF